ncbi:MAG TPA: Ig domain-containing protein, partial [Steroidobacteraceae bacterium]|nr:Ig domain-containing protein [Steroidobacteraceae bacterium]
MGESYSFSPTADDADGNTLLFTAENLPSWAFIDPGTGVVSGTPDAAAVGNADDITISVSDGKFTTQLAPFRISVVYPPVSRDDIAPAPTAQVTDTAEGYDLVGDAAVTVGDLVTDLTNADLSLRFDSSGQLIGMTGTVDVPQRIAPMLTAESKTHVAVGLYSGAELNASVDMGPDSISGILLRDAGRYMVYFLSSDSSFTFTGPSDKVTPISLNLGSAQSLLITDPSDPFFYLFGYVNGTGFGMGNSEHGLIPWRTVFEDDGPDAFPALQPFSGTDVYKGTMPLGFKVVDLLQLTGTGVCSPPPPFKSCELDWLDVLTSLANDDL